MHEVISISTETFKISLNGNDLAFLSFMVFILTGMILAFLYMKD